LSSDISSGRLEILDEEWTILGVNRLSRMSIIEPTVTLPT
jgi:hypothetical protein